MLSLEADVFRHAHLAQTVAIVRPFLWQVQAIRHRQARMAVGKRQRHRDLAVIFLASWPQYCRATPTERRPALESPVVISGTKLRQASSAQDRQLPKSDIFVLNCESGNCSTIWSQPLA